MFSFNSFLQRLAERFWAPTYPWPALDLQRPEHHFHCVASIHMGIPPMAPLPRGLLEQLQRCDGLVVEADLLNGEPLAWPVLEPPQPLNQRFPTAMMAQLVKRLREYQLDETLLNTQPAWHIALQLQQLQAQRLGLQPDYGIDIQALRAAHQAGCPVIELEGAKQQLTLLTALANQGYSLLEDTLDNWHSNARTLQTMTDWWLRGGAKVPKSLSRGYTSPLNSALLTERNRRWAETLSHLPRGRYVVVVGALHLFGPGSLPELLSPPQD